MTAISYRQARTIVAGFGTALICGVAVAAFYRGADLVEVGAILLFLPVLFGLVAGRVTGGVIAGVLVSIVYIAVRFTTIGDLPPGDFIGAAVVRVLLYLGLGAFGGWANRMLEESLRKLELYDEIDDDTGVGNARALLHVTDRELARADRYGSVFSFVVVHVGRDAFTPVGDRRAMKALRRACQTIESSVRTTDLVTRVPLGDREDVVVVLPETGRTGAEELSGRLVTGARGLLTEHGLAASNGAVTADIITYPGNDDQLAAYRNLVASVVEQRSLALETAGGTA